MDKRRKDALERAYARYLEKSDFDADNKKEERVVRETPKPKQKPAKAIQDKLASVKPAPKQQTVKPAPKPEPVKAEAPKAVQAEPVKVEKVKPEPVKAPAKPEPVKAEPVKAEPVKTEAQKRQEAMERAFARFLAENNLDADKSIDELVSEVKPEPVKVETPVEPETPAPVVPEPKPEPVKVEVKAEKTVEKFKAVEPAPDSKKKKAKKTVAKAAPSKPKKARKQILFTGKKHGAFHPITHIEGGVEFVGALGVFLAFVIECYDKFQDKVADILYNMWTSLNEEYVKIVLRYRNSRKRIANSILGIALVSCAMLIVFNYCIVYEYAYNGRVLGYVDKQSKVTDVLSVASEQLSETNGMKITFQAKDTTLSGTAFFKKKAASNEEKAAATEEETSAKGEEAKTEDTKAEDTKTAEETVAVAETTKENITFRRVTSLNKSVDSSDEVVNKLAYMTDIEIEAVGLFQDGKLLTVVNSEEAASRVAERAYSELTVPDEGMKVISRKYVGELSTAPISVNLTGVKTEIAAKEQLVQGANFDLYHIVNNGETLNSIAKSFGVEKESIVNPSDDKALEKVEVGDKVKIKYQNAPMQVELVEEGTMLEIIPFEEIKQETDSMYKGDTEVKQEGQEGRQNITGKITKVGGVVVERDLKSCDIIQDKKDRIILVGTADKPKTAPTGIFGMPIRTYVISSDYGYRWGTTHEGIDFASSVGVPIYASDGGTVVVSGWYGGYGLCIDIDHGNGYKTRYGHCSNLYVSVGEKVYKGQEIAAVGNTGRSTGPHLHFEIRKNGESLDPGPTLGLY